MPCIQSRLSATPWNDGGLNRKGSPPKFRMICSTRRTASGARKGPAPPCPGRAPGQGRRKGLHANVLMSGTLYPVNRGAGRLLNGGGTQKFVDKIITIANFVISHDGPFGNGGGWFGGGTSP